MLLSLDPGNAQMLFAAYMCTSRWQTVQGMASSFAVDGAKSAYSKFK